MPQISPGTIVVGIFAVLFGLAGAYAVREHLNKPQPTVQAPPPPPPVPLVTVPVAATDLQPGRPLKLSDIAVYRMTSEQMKQRGIKAGFMTVPQQIIGRILRIPATQGATFTTDQFYPEGFGPSLSERLRPGYRAMTVAIANDNTVAGMAVPGSMVDVLFRIKGDELEDLPETTVTLLESIEVLAYGHQAVPGQQLTNFQGTVTLAVTPEQASALKVVEGRGELSLAMRNPEDVEWTANRPQTLEGLLGLSRRPRRTTFSTDIYRAGKKQTLRFDAWATPGAPAEISFQSPVGRDQPVQASDANRRPAVTPDPNTSSQVERPTTSVALDSTDTTADVDGRLSTTADR